MAKIETVTGPIESGELGPTLIHEHLRCQDEAVVAQWPDRVTLSEDEPFAVAAGGEHAEAVKAAERALERGIRTIVDPTAMFLGRDVGFMRGVAERDRPSGRPLHRHLHLRPPAPVLPHPQPRADRGDVRRRHRARDPGDRDQGGLHQVRRRPSRPDRERHEGPPRGRDGERADRRADHGPLCPHGRHRAEAARPLRGGGRRPLQGPDRPLRRHRRRRLHRLG